MYADLVRVRFRVRVRARVRVRVRVRPTSRSRDCGAVARRPSASATPQVDSHRCWEEAGAESG